MQNVYELMIRYRACSEFSPFSKPMRVTTGHLSKCYSRPIKMLNRVRLERNQSCKRADLLRPKPEHISPNPKTNLPPKSCPKNLYEVFIQQCCQIICLYFCAPKTKSTSQARIKPEIFANLGRNSTRKARSDLQLLVK